MKFCPNCGNIIENKTICECGYNKETNDIEKINEEKQVDVGYIIDNRMMGESFEDASKRLSNTEVHYPQNDVVDTEYIIELMKKYPEAKGE